MDSIRQRQIGEVLNENMEINKLVMQMAKRNANLSSENALPYTQLNMSVIDSTGSLVNQLLVILEKRKQK
jgi:hypothetical protein